MPLMQPSPLKTARATKPPGIVSTLLGNCLCDPFLDARGAGTQFVELHGVRFIGLGAVVDELTPRERVYDTLEQLTTRRERLISIGYVIDETLVNQDTTTKNAPPVVQRKSTETIPLDVWNQSYPGDSTMTGDVNSLVSHILCKRYHAANDQLTKALARQRSTPDRGFNKYLAGITAHNLAVCELLAGNDDEAVQLMEEAVILKENAFGKNHPEVGITWDELGIQYFARGRFEDSLATFRKAYECRAAGSMSLLMVLNNMACCNLQLRNHRTALLQLDEARALQQEQAKADLDLLHVAVVMCNCGYLHLCLKQYEEARSLLEEALLIQQSVLDDNHRAVRDTLSNIEFTNAFHS